MSAEPRISPVDADTAEAASKEIVDGNRSRWGKPLLPYLLCRSRRVAERSGARAAGQMEVVGLTWDRYVWPLATGGAPQLQPASTK